ncbi:unnamed protein product, partial [Ectocarpus sp. 12 AP-2014]
LGQLARCCRRLGTLYLQYCSFVTDVGVQTLAVEVNHEILTSLDLSGCVLLSDYSIVALGQLCRKLRRLNLKALNRVTEEGASSRACQIQTLNLAGCCNLTDMACAYIVQDPVSGSRRGASLTSLNLGYCLNITDNGVARLVASATKLLHINLAGCVQLTDEGVLTLVSTCTRLQEVVFAQCKHLTD